MLDFSCICVYYTLFRAPCQALKFIEMKLLLLLKKPKSNRKYKQESKFLVFLIINPQSTYQNKHSLLHYDEYPKH